VKEKTDGTNDGGFTNLLRRVARQKMFLVMLGGAIGTLARYELGRWAGSQWWGREFPWGTFIINVSGSFILAALSVLIRERVPAEYGGDLSALLGIGFCGGFTTFSTFEWETYRLFQERSYGLAMANAFGSLAAGFVGVMLGVMVVRAIFPRM
jgi:fluoride exporter